MTDYSDLVAAKTTDGSIKQWVNHSEIPATTILTEAQSFIYRRLRAREMLTTSTGTLSTGASTITLSTGYLQAEHFMFVGSTDNTVAGYTPSRALSDEVFARYSYDSTGARTPGSPQKWSTDATNLFFDVPSDKERPYQFHYYKRPAALSTSSGSTTNFLTQEYPSLLRATCMFKAYEYLKNTQEKAYWLTIARQELQDAEGTADLEQAGLPLIMEII